MVVRRLFPDDMEGVGSAAMALFMALPVKKLLSFLGVFLVRACVVLERPGLAEGEICRCCCSRRYCRATLRASLELRRTTMLVGGITGVLYGVVAGDFFRSLVDSRAARRCAFCG